MQAITGRNKRDFDDDVSQDEDEGNNVAENLIYDNQEEDAAQGAEPPKPNQRFKSYYHLFKSLTKHKVVPT